MKRKIYIFTALALSALAIASCFGIPDENFAELAPIELGETDEVINAPLGEEFIYDKLQIKSEKEVVYEWCMGKKNPIGEKWDMLDCTVISNDPQIRYTFSKTGTYVLRLKVDNGESIEFRFFTLNVNSGFDEGVVILNNDDDGNGALTFIKKLSTDEQSSGAKEVYENVIEDVNPDLHLKKVTDVYMDFHTTGGVEYRSLLISSNDEDGNIYKFEPKTFEFYNKVPMKSQLEDHCVEFTGDDASGSNKFCVYMRGESGKTFRYDLFGDFVGVRTDGNQYDMKDCTMSCCYTSPTSMKSTRKPVLYTESILYQPSNGKMKVIDFKDYKIVNMCSMSTANKLYVMLQKKEDPTQFSIKQTTGTLSTPKDVIDFTAKSLNMDENSVMLNTRNSADAYYTFNNKIYRWSLMTKPYESPVELAIPDGEIIRTIATNYMKSAEDETKETLLYVATYNPDRSGEKKGSLYVFNFSDNRLVKAYEGICNNPVKVIYKYRM